MFFFAEFLIPAILLLVRFSRLKLCWLSQHSALRCTLKNRTYCLFVDNWENYSGPVMLLF